MGMQEDLTDAAKDFRKQISAGIKPDIGCLVLLACGDGLGMNTNIPKERLVAMLEALVQRVKLGDAGGLIVPPGRVN